MFHSSLLSIILLFMLSLLSKADDNAPYPGCGPYNCGAKTYDVRPPFWLPDGPDNCSHPGFELACGQDKSILTINIGDKAYQIKSFDYKNKVLTVINPDLSGEECPHAFTDPVSSSSPFRYLPSEFNLYFYFNCTSDSSTDLLYRINCATGEIQLDSYYSFSELPPSDLPEKCSSNASFPINKTAHLLLIYGKMNFSEGMQDGINVTWTAGQEGCQCQDSGNPGENSNNSNIRRKIGIGLTAGLGVFFLASLMFLRYLRQCKLSIWKKSNSAPDIEEILEKFGSLAPKRYRPTLLSEWTSAGFSSFEHDMTRGELELTDARKIRSMTSIS